MPSAPVASPARGISSTGEIVNAERGFRRVVLAASVAALCLGLGAVGLLTFKAARVQSAQNWYTACVRHAGHDLWKPGLQGAEWQRAYEATPKHVLDDCRLAADFPEYAFPDAVFDAFNILGFSSLDWPVSKVLALSVAIGAALSAGVAAVPWGVFYLARWVARGFRDGGDVPGSHPRVG